MTTSTDLFTDKRILAIDPGGTTGVAMWVNGEVQGCELPIETADRELFAYIFDRKPDLVVCESFRITAATAKNTQAPWSLELIGVVKLACKLADVELKMQAPGDAKGFSTDYKLKAVGWYQATKGNHLNDALRHLMVALVNNGWWDDRLLKDR